MLFLKKDEVLEIVLLNIFDFISLNETKLDDSIPFLFFLNSNYITKRKDRNRVGGGLLVLIKMNLKILNCIFFDNTVAISIELQSNNENIIFLFSYKPLSTDNLLFISFLEQSP